MSEWKTYKLSELVEIKYGKDHKHLADGEIPLYGSGGIMRYVDTPLYEQESILIPRKGTLSNLFYLNIPFWSVDTMFYTKIKAGNNGKYLYYLLKSMDLASMNVGSAVPSLTTEVLNKVEINVPDEATQKEIAQILSSLDDKIELNLQMNQTLEAMAQALFKEWFVDFKFPGFDGQLVNGLPKGWRIAEIRELISVKDGTHDSPKQQQKGKYLITSKHLKNHFIDFESAYKVSKEDFDKINKRSKVDTLDVLITMIGTVGNLYFVHNLDIDFAIKNIGLFKTSEKPDLAYFLYFSLASKEISDYYTKRLAGSTQQYLTLEVLRQTPILLPDESVLSQYNETAKSLYYKIQENSVQIQTLNQTRDTLLPKLMSGQIELV